ncbi:hypothetical protein LINPERHAP1_LOCUS34917 [Linum perenne]
MVEVYSRTRRASVLECVQPILDTVPSLVRSSVHRSRDSKLLGPMATEKFSFRFNHR